MNTIFLLLEYRIQLIVIKTIYNGKESFSIKFKKINNIIKVKGAKK